MTRTKSILAVVDPTAAVQPAAARAAAVAASLGCQLELLICHHDTRFAGYRLFAAKEQETLREQQLRHQLGYLNTLATELADAGVQIRTKVVWDAPLSEAIIRETLRSEPLMVFKDTHHHATISRTLFTNTDWQLIRDCPCPLWLVKPAGLDEQPAIIAAVDPMHEHAKPAALDALILDQATELATRLGGSLHVYHGFDTTPAIARAGSFTMTSTPIPVDEISARVRAAHADAFARLLEDRQINPANQHLLAGTPVELLPGLARKLNAGLVIMGAVSRGRLARAAIGSTAEMVLDYLPCDVLIVKPAGFDSAAGYPAPAKDFMQMDGPG